MERATSRGTPWGNGAYGGNRDLRPKMYNTISSPYILVGGYFLDTIPFQGYKKPLRAIYISRGAFYAYATIPGSVGAGIAEHVAARQHLVPNFNRYYEFR